MREMKDSGVPWIGEIPKGWKLLRNKNAFLCSKEIVGSKSMTAQLLSLTTKGIKEKGPEVVGGKVPESFDTYQTVRKGQLVMCLFDLDCSAVFSGLSPYDGMISPAYRVLDCKADMDPSFASHWFCSVFDGRKFMHYSKNLRYTLTYDEFAVLPIVIPPIQEQHRIADFLDAKCTEIDTILEKTRASIEDYKKLKLSVITEAVTKGIRGERPMKDSGVEWIGEIPTEWKTSRVGLHFEIILGKMLCSEPLGADYTLEKYYCAANVHFSGVDKCDLKTMWFSSSEKEAYLVKEGDLLVVEGGAGAGGSAIVKDQSERIYIQNSIMIVRPKAQSSAVYLRYLLESLVSRGYVDFACNKATIPHFTKDKLGQVPFLLPEEAEQQEIAAYLDEKCAAIDSLIASKEALITELETYKKSIIYEYVTGKKEVL